MGALPAPKSSPLTREMYKIKGRVDNFISRMRKDHHFSPTRDNLDVIAEEIIDFINTYHSKTSHHESHLKAAIIDLTEVPVMSPQMQRIAFLAALEDASKEIDLFMSYL